MFAQTQATYRVGETVTIDATVSNGYTWTNWTGTGIQGSNDKQYTFTMPTNDITLTANAIPTQYTITYELNGGNVTGNPTTYNIETENFTLKNPTKTGYTFTGWTGSNGETPQKQVSISRGSTGAKTYIANWQVVTGLSYTVKYLEKGTNTELDRKTVSGKTFGDEIAASTEVKNIPGYDFDSASPTKLIITTGENILNIYYTKKDATVIVHHYLQGTTQQVSPDVLIQGKVFDEYTTTPANINDTYELVANPENATGQMTEQVIEVTYYYILRQANISKQQMYTTEKGKNYVTAGEKITYTTTVSNNGNLEKDVIIKNNIPEGTTFVNGSIKIDGIAREDLTQENLIQGIEINLPIQQSETMHSHTITFEVTVNENNIGDIISIATVDEQQIEEIKIPVITYQKSGTIIRKDETSKLGENEVTVGDRITYTIRVNNTGTTNVNNITVEDIIPEGTKYISIDAEGIHNENISWEIAQIDAENTKEVSFTVEVKYAYEDYTITSIGKVNDKETNSVQFQYKKPTISILGGVTNTTPTQNITSKDTPIYYEIEVNSEVNFFAGKAILTVVYKLQYPINESESDIAGGTYDEKTKTITWVKEIVDIDTFKTGEAHPITLRKAITLSYDYGILDGSIQSLKNVAEYDITLLEKKIENEEYTEVQTQIDKKEENSKPETEIKINIPAEVIVEHYLYDETYTQTKLADNQTIEGIIGQEYLTTKSDIVPANYTCINEEPEGYTGKMKEGTTIVKYYYKLIDPKIEDNIEITTEINNISSSIEDGEVIISKEDEEIKYVITYNSKIKDYKGKAKIKLVDELPSGIDLSKSDIAGGIYDEENHTITWTKEINLDTFTNGDYEEQILKEIKVVYVGQDITKPLVNKVKGKVTTYYPIGYPGKEDTELVNKTTQEQAEVTVKVEQEYKANFKVQINWDDNENLKEKRPDSVIVEIKVMPSNKTLVKELNESNNWKYEERGLPKYNAEGALITYTVTQTEAEENDLEYYDEAIVERTETPDDNTTNYIYTVTNSYKLTEADFNTIMTVRGTEEIGEKGQLVEYNINFKSEINDYIGEGKVLIVNTLPYRINVEESELNGGQYDAERKTITWEIELSHINTTIDNKANRSRQIYTGTYNEEGAYVVDITKQIRLNYVDVDLTKEKMTNMVKGKLELYETEQKEEKTINFDTNINVQGRVIVKHIIRNGTQLTQVGETQIIQDKIGKDYATEEKAVGNYYKCVETTNNTQGKIKEGDTEVIYYYEIPKARITIKHVIELEGKYEQIATTETISTKYLGETYELEEKEIENYRFVKVVGKSGETITEKEIEITEENIEIIYIYEKIPAKVIIKYLIKDETGEKELLPSETINGFVGENYEVSRKAITGYKAVEPEPQNASGKLTEQTIEVKYYYEILPSGIFKVKYVDMETNEEIIYREGNEEKVYGYEIKGLVGQEYETKEKEIPYYVYVNSTENTKGKLTEEGDTIIYNYRKQNFNMSVDKTIESIELNGNSINISDNKLAKLEIKSKDIENANLIIKYNIKVKNEGELAGKTKISEKLPEGYELIESKEWKIETDGTLEKDIELEPGQSKDLKLTLKWINSEENLGGRTSITQIIESENLARFKDINTEDDISMATVIIGPKTGELVNNIIIGMLTASLGICLYIMIVLIGRVGKEPTFKKIKFLNK